MQTDPEFDLAEMHAYIKERVPDGALRTHLMSRASKATHDLSCRIGIEGEVCAFSVLTSCGLDLVASGIKPSMPDYCFGRNYIEVTKPRVRDQDTYDYLLSRADVSQEDRELFYDHVQSDITQPLYKKMFGQLTRWDTASKFKSNTIYLLVDLSDFVGVDISSSRVMHDILYGRRGAKGISLDDRFRWGEAPINAAYLHAFDLSRLAGVIVIPPNGGITFYENPNCVADTSLIDVIHTTDRYTDGE